MKTLSRIAGLLLLSGCALGVQKFDSCTLLSNCSEVLSNSIVGSPQYSVPYYSSLGIGSTLTGLVPGTYGQVLTSSGTAGAPFWGAGGGGSGVGSNCTLINDASNNLWSTCVDTTGHLVTTSLGTSPLTLAPITLVDSNGVKWDLVIHPTGNLETKLH